MADIPKGKKKVQRTPPPMDRGPQNLKKEASNELVGMNLSVTPEFRKLYKTYAVDNDLSMADLCRISFEFYRQHHGN